MACTVAVEESIARHYNNQIRTLMEEDPEKYEELLQVCMWLHSGKGLGKGTGLTQFGKKGQVQCEGP